MAFKYSNRLMLLMLALTSASRMEDRQVYAGSCCESGSKAPVRDTMPETSNSRHQPRSESSFLAPHGGQLTKTIWNYYEVVYAPLETRVYVYDMFRAPVRVGGVQGKANMRVRSSGDAFSSPLRYEPVLNGQDYLAVSVDLRRVQDGDMDVEFQVDNIPNSAEPSVLFTQVYGVSGTSESATVQLASMGKTPAAGQSGMSCHSASGSGEGRQMAGGQGDNSSKAGCCSDRADGVVRTAPGSHDMFAQRPSGGHDSLHQLPSAGGPVSRAEDKADRGTSPRVVVARAASVDEAAIRLQRVCPITNQPLGSHGAPTKLLIDGQALFVCCPGCIEKVKQNPEKFLAMVAR